jgi:uncharacterized membrane protein
MMEYETIYPDEELYEDEDVEALEDEGSNRTFIILVGALGGLLAVAICIFVVWAFVINPRMSADRITQNQSIEATNEAILLTSQPEEEPTNTPRPAPTDAPEPTATPVPPTATSQPPTPTRVQPTPTSNADDESVVEEGESTPAAVAEAEATNTPRSTTGGRATSTPIPGKTGVPETGIGVLGYGALAMGMLFLLVVARRLRRAS